MKVTLETSRYNNGQSAFTNVSLELTRRNLLTLLEKLDDPESARTLSKDSDPGEPLCRIFVRAVEDAEHYAERPAGLVYKPSSRTYH